MKATAKKRKGLSLLELVVVIVFVAIAILAIGVVVADSQRGWNKMYNRVYSDVVIGAHVARRTFDSVIRKAAKENTTIDPGGQWVQVSYFQDADSVELDRYARFYTSGGELKIEYGNLDTGNALSTQTVCSNVDSCVFTTVGTSIQMFLALDNDAETAVVATSAIPHN